MRPKQGRAHPAYFGGDCKFDEGNRERHKPHDAISASTMVLERERIARGAVSARMEGDIAEHKDKRGDGIHDVELGHRPSFFDDLKILYPIVAWRVPLLSGRYHTKKLQFV